MMKTAEELIQKKSRKIVSVPPGAAVREALEVMVGNRIGSILIMEKGKVLGIWTERDFMEDALAEGFNIGTSKIRDLMTTELHYARYSDPDYILMDKFLGLGIRHLLVEKNGELIGLLSSRDVVKTNLWAKYQELKEQNAKTSWEYYEEWGWKPEGLA